MIYVFGNHELDTLRYELRQSGEPLRIEPKAFDLLAYLIENHDQVVSKDNLFEHLWPDQFVGESALSYYIATARKAIGDNGRDQRMIKTVYSRGYSFIAPLEERTDQVVGQEVEATTIETAPTALSPSPSQNISADDTAPLNQPPLPRGRRQLTVMECSIVTTSSSSLSLDPEERHDSIRQAQIVCRTIIQQYTGYMAQYLSHGLLAYFGYPQAHEDDARQAVHAGLAILNAVQQLSHETARKRNIEISIRVGLHTGIVAIGATDIDDPREPLILGDVPHLASQVANVTAPNTIALTPAAWKLVDGYFISKPLGAYFIDDFPEPITLYQVLRESEAQSRIEAAIATRLTPFIGREQEVGLLQERWKQSEAGMGQVVLLSGDAGIGKSRLVHVLYEHVSTLPHTRIEWRCSPHTQHTALYPVIDYFQRRLQFERTEPAEAQFEKIRTFFTSYGYAQDETVQLLADLLSSSPLTPTPTLATGQPPKQNTPEVLLAWLLHEAEQQPVCMVMEDLHWADAATVELLSLLIDHVPTTRILVLLTYRSEFRPPWDTRSYIAPLALNRLPNQQVENMILQITQGKALPAEVLHQLIAKADGVPLFVEEVTRMVVESGLIKEEDGRYQLTASLQPLTLPSTLHDSLMARLDRLEIGKQTIQLAAVIGREFPYELIQAVATIDEIALQQELSQLVEAELLYQRGLFPHAQYLFKHALIQEAAYQSLLGNTRKRYHQQIAEVMEAQFAVIRDTQPELLAFHFNQANLTEPAIIYWQLAAKRAIEQSAYLDALVHVQQGLSVIAELPDNTERHQLELSLQTMLGATITFTKGVIAPELDHIYNRAYALCEQVGDTSQLFDVLRGWWLHNLMRADLRTANELGERLLSLAQQQNDAQWSVEAHRNIATSLFFQGDQLTATQHLELGLSQSQTDQSGSLTPQYFQDTKATLLSYIAWSQWIRGYPDQALHTMHEALQRREQRDHSYSQSFTFFTAAVLYLWRREPDAAHQQIEASITLADTHGFPHQLARTIPLRGWLAIQNEQSQADTRQLQEAISTYRARGDELFSPYLLGLLADAHRQTGDIEAGLQTLDEALALAHTYDLQWWEAELHRLQGELLLQQPTPAAAPIEIAFQQALDVAREQHAKSLELRAAISLSRLWQQQGKRDQARTLLGEIYGWFTEGHETTELQDAKALLASLA